MIHTQGLTKHFRKKKTVVEAVRGVDIAVEQGEMVALLGPNGAGKSTTLRMLTTLLPPTAGTATVAGHDVRSDPAGVRQRIGYIGQGNGAAYSMRARDELISQGCFYGMETSEARRRADDLLELFDLQALAQRSIMTMSGGQRRRLDIALGLMHRPPLLFLDEPSTGLDPQNRANLWEHIMRLRQEHGTTILLTTHYLDEADSMSGRVLVIDHGQVIADDAPERLKADLAGDRIMLRFADEDAATTAIPIVARMPSAQIERRGALLDIRVAGGIAELPGLLYALRDADIAVQSAETKRPTLDDVFLNLTGRAMREE